MADVDIEVEILDTSGTSVLDVSEANGYEIVRAEMPERSWRRSTADAPDVEGDVEVHSVLAAGIVELEIKCAGSTGSATETLRTNLINAAEARAFRLRVQGLGVSTTWQARRADSRTLSDDLYWLHSKRTVVLRVPVQPTPIGA